MGRGEQSVMTSGVLEMQLLSVASWDMLMLLTTVAMLTSDREKVCVCVCVSE